MIAAMDFCFYFYYLGIQVIHLSFFIVPFLIQLVFGAVSKILIAAAWPPMFVVFVSHALVHFFIKFLEVL